MLTADLSRRAAMVLGIGVVAAGCGRPGWLQARGHADATLVRDAASLSAILEQAAASRPAVAAMHRAHLAGLQAISADKLPIPQLAPAPGPLLPREQAAITHFDDLAVRASDGRVARLFAEMSAAITQRIASGGIA